MTPLFNDLLNEMQNLSLEIYTDNVAFAAYSKTIEQIEEEIELFRANLTNGILHDFLANGKPRFSNDEARKTQLRREESLSDALKTLKTTRANTIETQAQLKALIEKKRKLFRIAELNFLATCAGTDGAK